LTIIERRESILEFGKRRQRERDREGRLAFSSSTEARVEEVVTTSISRAILCFTDERDGRMLKIVPKEFDECVFKNVSDF